MGRSNSEAGKQQAGSALAAKTLYEDLARKDIKNSYTQVAWVDRSVLNNESVRVRLHFQLGYTVQNRRLETNVTAW